MNLARLSVFFIISRRWTSLFVVGLDKGPHQHHDGEQFECAVKPVAQGVHDTNADEGTKKSPIEGRFRSRIVIEPLSAMAQAAADADRPGQTERYREQGSVDGPSCAVMKQGNKQHAPAHAHRC